MSSFPSVTATDPPSRFSPRFIGLAAAVITVTIWTAFIVVARASADPARNPSLNAFDIAAARVLGASLVLLPWGWWLVHRERAAAKVLGVVAPASSLWGFSPLPLRTTATVGLFGGGLYALLVYSGFVYAPAVHASVLLPGSLPLWTALLAIVVLHDHITPTRALGLACIVGGDLLVGGPSLLHAFDGGEVWKGDLLFMLASSCWAVYSVLARHYRLDAVKATIAITAFAFFTYFVAYNLLLALHWVPGHFWTAPWRDVLFQMGMQGIGSVVISGITFTTMIQHYGPVRSTMITALVPGLSALAAVLFLNEPLHWNVVVGLVLVTFGILLGVLKVRGVA